MLAIPERPYSTFAEREEQLPFRVRIATAAQDVERAVEIRASAYSRHLPDFGETLRNAEKEDFRPDVLLLIAERKLDRRPIGSMRLEPNFSGPLGIESETTLPAHFRNKRLVETTRLGVDNGIAGTLVMAALVKASFEICSASGIDYGIAVGRRSVGEMFRSLCFDVIEGPLRMSYSQRNLFWVFAIPTLGWEARLRERGHFYFDFMARTNHPDIDIDYDRVFEAFGRR
jgi:N-acyl amino acid synthase FeeM